MISYGKQNIDNRDIKGVIKVLKSEYLTQGPIVKIFEKKIAKKSLFLQLKRIKIIFY